MLPLTRSKADEIFGKAWKEAAPGSAHDPIGKVFYNRTGTEVQKNEYSTSTIVGVIEDIPDNAHFRADYINHNIMYESMFVWGFGS